ncbi:MAG: aldo/keto reductase [Chloroflexi bacterium]|nr:aldo/keto reductase [Chloroflexota bacterium]
MEYRSLGNSGLRVSVSGLGTNNFGGRADLEQTKAVMGKCLDLGVNLIDTAESYGRGLSEEYIGVAIKGHRQEVLIATKAGASGRPGTTGRGYLRNALEGSLKRLGTDYIDLYQIHYADPTTPIEETLAALDDMVRGGAVRYVGCSNFAPWQVVEAQGVATTSHFTPFISAQNQYSLLNRTVERELAPVCMKYGLGIMPYSPLAGGFLTGKYRPGEAPPEGARLSNPQQASRQLTDENFAKLAQLEAFAEEHDHTVGELALAWLASQPHVPSVIAGAMTPQQVEENVKAVEWHLAAEELRELDEATGWEQPGRGGMR